MGGVIINARPIVILGASGTAVSAAADTNENTLATITVPAGAMGLRGILRITTSWTTTSSANNKTLRVRFSGGAGTQYATLVYTTSVSAFDVRYIINRDSATSQVGSMAAKDTGLGAGGGALVTSSVDTTAATTVVITGQKASAGETLTLGSYLVELITP